VGQAVGSKNASAVQLSAYVSLITGVGLMLIIALLYSIFAKNLIAFDIDITQIQNNHVIFLAKNLLIIVAIFQIFDCIRLIAMASLRGMEDTKIPMYITLFIYWLIGLTLSYFLGFVLDLEVIGVWYGMLAAMIIGSLAILFRLRLFLQKV
jgi:MATE family multidrug resistance protein